MNVHVLNRLMLCCAAVLAGCSSASISNTPRTSTEQLLVANAVDQALDKVDFSPFAGHNVYLDDKYVDCVDKNYVIASTRHRLFKAGAYIVPAADKADVVVEVRAGAVGTASAVSYLGTPEVTLPGMMSIPEVRMIERKRQEGTAKIGIVAYDAKTNQVLGDGGTTLARSTDSNWFVAGIGPYQDGTVRREVSTGTSGKAAESRGHIPYTVAFDAPASSPANPDALRYAAGQKPPEDVTPAAHAAPVPTKAAPAAQAPDWAKVFAD